LDYDTDFREPSIDQLQPISDNSDPLNIYQGNPSLKPEYNHRIRMRYNKFNQANMHNFFGNISMNYTLDKIVNEQVVSANFVRITRPVNVKDAFSSNGFLGYGMPMGTKWRFNFNNNSSYNRGISLVNQTENITKRLTSTNNIRMDYRLRDSFDFSIGARVSYNNTAYSLQSSLNRRYYTHEYEASFNVTLPWNLRLVSDFSYQFYTGIDVGANQSIPIWNASVSKMLFKNKKGELKLAVLDILNKNTGFTRTSDANYIQDELTNSLRRYVMLSFTYAINPLMGNNRGGNRGGGGGPRMMITRQD
jgi:Outer membrane protein beta-barrel family